MKVTLNNKKRIEKQKRTKKTIISSSSPLVVVDDLLVVLLQKLEFTVSNEPRSPTSSVSMEKVAEQLEEFLIRKNVNNEEVFDWIEVSTLMGLLGK